MAIVAVYVADKKAPDRPNDRGLENLQPELMDHRRGRRERETRYWPDFPSMNTNSRGYTHTQDGSFLLLPKRGGARAKKD